MRQKKAMGEGESPSPMQCKEEKVKDGGAGERMRAGHVLKCGGRGPARGGGAHKGTVVRALATRVEEQVVVDVISTTEALAREEGAESAETNVTRSPQTTSRSGPMVDRRWGRAHRR